MGGYEELIAGIKDVVRRNGRREITGDALQQVLVGMVSAIGANSAFAGVANPETDPGSPDANVFWIAAQPGTYKHFGNAVVTASAVLSNETGEWVATPLNFGGGGDMTVPEFEFFGKMHPGRAMAVDDQRKTIVYYHYPRLLLRSVPKNLDEWDLKIYTYENRRNRRGWLEMESIRLDTMKTIGNCAYGKFYSFPISPLKLLWYKFKPSVDLSGYFKEPSYFDTLARAVDDRVYGSGDGDFLRTGYSYKKIVYMLVTDESWFRKKRKCVLSASFAMRCVNKVTGAAGTLKPYRVSSMVVFPSGGTTSASNHYLNLAVISLKGKSYANLI